MRWISLLCSLLICGCSSVPAATSEAAVPVPTMPSVRIAQAALPTASPTRELRPVESVTPTVAPATPQQQQLVYRCDTADAPYPTDYTIVANTNYTDKVVDVSQRLTYRNRTGEVLTDLVLAVEPNSAPGQFQLTELRFNDLDIDYLLDANRLWIPLPAGLQDGCSISLDMAYRINVPRIGDTRLAYKGYLGYSERQLNLGNWTPVVAPRMEGRWIVNDTFNIGEQAVSDQARWTVNLNVTGGGDTMTVAMPGDVEQSAPGQWRSVFDGGRDFTISMSPSFRVLRQRAISGAEIEVYVFPDTVQTVEGGVVDGGAHALAEGVKAFQQFEALFGLYPYKRLAIVQGDFPDGMEFSGLVYVSTTWFYSFRGTVRNYLTIITVHEVAHQWWYAQVGSNSALVPWLDEALSTYSEYIYYEEYYPEERNWWWSTRVGYYDPKGLVDSTIYEFSNAREYINAVYLRGVQMLHRLREDIGTEAFFDLLAAYADRGNGRIATSQTFWELLSPEQWQQTSGTRQQFLGDPSLGRP